MFSREIDIDGVTFLRSRDAARIVQLAPDYISRVARAQLIEGRLINGLWFVAPSLSAKIHRRPRAPKGNLARGTRAQTCREEQIRAGHARAERSEQHGPSINYPRCGQFPCRNRGDYYAPGDGLSARRGNAHPSRSQRQLPRRAVTRNRHRPVVESWPNGALRTPPPPLFFVVVSAAQCSPILAP